jgi:DNA-binding CsgD family transcriptional regulator
LLPELKRASQDPSRFIVQPLTGPGVPHVHLVRVIGSGDPAKRLRAVARQWKLTGREAAVVMRVVKGVSNKEIANALGCHLRTVEFHLTRVFDKAGVEGRSALTARFWSA